ncbi:MAG TPA: hypothetical protein VI197_04010 [Polyangiaceae bacterium]
MQRRFARSTFRIHYGTLVEVGGAISVTAGVLGTYDDLRFFRGSSWVSD